GGGIDEVRDAPMPGQVEHVEMADQVALRIGARIVDRMADPGLRAEVDDPVDPMAVECGVERRMVGEIAADVTERTVRGRRGLLGMGDSVELEPDRVIIVEIVYPDHLFAPREQAQGAMHADEAGGAGDEDGHARLLKAWARLENHS